MPNRADTTLLETLTPQDLAPTLQKDATTLVPDTVPLESTARAIAALEQRGAIADGLALGATIGEGGMGIVRTATQLSLGRRVAVKTLRQETITEEAKLGLLREAWITGSLEHPNIVPVHDVGLDDDDNPVIVLKHIEGLAWSHLISDPAAVTARTGAVDLLDYNLRVLVQVCSAVSLAHARGIIHRDIKPSNVMIGSLGEVYLVDWGLAASLRSDPSGRLPLATDKSGPAGTPAYMAPEMLGDGRLSERTDVYLLGATLYEILTGQAPHEHAGDSFRPLVSSILLSSPTFGPDVPKELAELATRAMSPIPADRVASATEFRERIEWYLRHRASLALSAEASLRVDELRALLRRSRDADRVRHRIHNLFAEARFAFRHALRSSADNVEAKAGLRALTELVVGFELERGTVEAAAAALAELDDPPLALRVRVAKALHIRDANRLRIADLEARDAQHDRSANRQGRWFTALVVSVFWVVAPEMLGWLAARHPAPPHWLAYVHTSSMAVFVSAIIWAKRDALAKSVLNRLTPAMLLAMCATQLTLEVGGWLLALPLRTLLPLHIFGWLGACAAFSLAVDRRFMPSTIGFLVGFLYACRRPDDVWHVMTVTAVIVALNAVYAWRSDVRRA